MLKKYKMPNGRTYQFEESKAPECAVPVTQAEKKVEPLEKAAEPETKAIEPKNKARKAAKK